MSAEGDAIRYYRSEAGLTLRELSARSGITIGQLNRHEVGKSKTMSIDTLRRIAEGLDVSPTDLLESSPEVRWQVCSACDGRGMVRAK